MAVKVRPLDDRILVKQSEAEKTTAGGIVLPDSAKEKPLRGKVVAVGAGKLLNNGTRAALDVKKGDEVIYAKYGGTEVDIDGEVYMILQERDILGVVEG